MANRYFRSQFRYSFQVQSVDLFGKISFGAAGAPTLNVAASKGIASVAQNGTGDYTITLQDPYVSLLHLGVIMDTSAAGGGGSAGVDCQIKAQNVSASGGGTIRLLLSNVLGNAANPDSGEVMLLKITLSNSNA